MKKAVHEVRQWKGFFLRILSLLLLQKKTGQLAEKNEMSEKYNNKI